MTRRSDAGRGALEDLAFTRQSSAAPSGDPISELELLLERVRRLRYDHNNPERFHAERSDIAGAIGGLLKRMRGGPERSRPLVSLPAGSHARRRFEWDTPTAALAFQPCVAPERARSTLHLKGAHAARD